MKKISFLVIAFLFVVIVSMPSLASATTTYDLKTDWSNSVNPNGAWAYRQGTTVLPLQTDYYSLGQYAWANEPFPAIGHVPVWIQAAVNGALGANVMAGDIMVHPTSVSSSLPLGEGNITWTSPINGTITISGNVWWGGWNGETRGVTWLLFDNSTQLNTGTMYNGNSSTRSNPVNFGSFTETVSVGDTVMFEAITASGVTYPWFVGVNLTIDAEPIQSAPEPATMLLLGLGLAGLVGFRRKLKK
jgi:hypothetical protein